MEKKKTINEKSVTVKNCVLNGVVFDGQAIEAIVYVAQGLKNLTELFKSQNIQIDSLISIGKEED